MPEIEIEIQRTVTITREESVVVTVDVPTRVTDNEEVLDWVDDIMEKSVESMTAKEKAVYETVTGAAWDPSDEDETIEYHEANVTG